MTEGDQATEEGCADEEGIVNSRQGPVVLSASSASGATAAVVPTLPKSQPDNHDAKQQRIEQKEEEIDEERTTKKEGRLLFPAAKKKEARKKKLFQQSKNRQSLTCIDGTATAKTTSTTPFPKCGVRLSYLLGEFITEICGGGNDLVIKESESWSTEEICERFIKPPTAEKQISFCTLLKQQNHWAYSDTANVFISHAHQCEFWNLTSALQYNLIKSPQRRQQQRQRRQWKQRGEGEGEDEGGQQQQQQHAGEVDTTDITNATTIDDIVIWLDIFSINQHQTTDWTFDWLCNTFQHSIQEFGHTIMVMSPWDKPIPFQRAWCILEAYWTCVGGKQFEIAMGESDRIQFLEDISKDVSSTIDRMLASIQAEKSQCSIEDDRKRIFEVIESSNIGGFWTINSLVFEQYRSWMMDVVREALEDCGTEDTPDRLRHLNILGLLYANQGKHQKAQSLLQECYERSRVVLGEHDNATLWSMHSLALSYYRQDKFVEATSLCKACLEKQTELLGEDHRETLRSLSLLANLKSSVLGQAEATSLYEEVYEKRRRVFGENEGTTLFAMKAVAISYTKMGWYDKALPVSEEVVERSREFLGPNHPTTFGCLQHLAILYDKLKRFTESRHLFEECLENRITTLGANHPRTISLIGTFVLHYRDQGLYDEALNLICLEKIRTGLGEKDETFMKSMYWAADLHYRKENFVEAQRLFEEYLEKILSVSAQQQRHHPKQAMRKLAKIYEMQGDNEKAILLRNSFKASQDQLYSIRGDSVASLKDSLRSLSS